MLNEVSQIVLKIDFVFVIGTTLFHFSLKITPDSRFVLLGLISGVLSLCFDAVVVTATTAELKPCQIV